MLRKYIKKKRLQKLRNQLKGARKLRNELKPFFVFNICSDLTKVDLGLNKSDFPKSLIGDYADIGEVLLRQLLLERNTVLCSAIMQSIGGSSSFKYPLPGKWMKHISDNGILVSLFLSQLYLLFSSIKKILFGFVRFSIYLLQRINTINQSSAYVAFLGLQQNNLPESENKNSYDIISWYNKSNIKKKNIKIILAQAKVKNDYNAPEYLIVSRLTFPRINNLKRYLFFFLKGIRALFVAIIGVLQGKWWYGYLYNESIHLHYCQAIQRESLAENYFFNNSNWFYKPLWTYDVEKRDSIVTLYHYSTNYTNQLFSEFIDIDIKDIYGIEIMKWKNIIVWDKDQMDFLKKYAPIAHYTIVGSLDFSDCDKLLPIPKQGYNIAIFDVASRRTILYTSLGQALEPYYFTELGLQFFADIKLIMNDSNINLLWKSKRHVSRESVSSGYITKRDAIINNSFIIVDSEISARRLIEKCDAVISMPFTSTAIIAKKLGKPSVYYDALSLIQSNESHGIPVLKNKNELENWFNSLNNYKAVSTNA
jgi:polysaccharide biosynthesis PFTS motif protein